MSHSWTACDAAPADHLHPNAVTLMNGSVPITLLCSAALAFACGPRARNESASAQSEPARVVSVNAASHFSFEVTNAGKKKLELTFADGRTHEFVVLDSLGREVWRWSEGRIFTQSMQNRVLRTSDLLRYQDAWDAPAPGRYVAVATLASANFPVTQRVEFTVAR
jgi:hypothetical protein